LGIEEIATYASVAIFVFGMITFAVFYRRVLNQTIEEYKRSKIVLLKLLDTFHKLTKKLPVLHVRERFETVPPSEIMNQTIEKLQMVELKLTRLSKQVQDAYTIESEFKTRVLELQRVIQSLTQTQEGLQQQIRSLNEQIQQKAIPDQHERIRSVNDIPFTNLSETQREVLDILVKKGSMTAPKMEKKIGKTREHTARLLKNLWQEGYIERDAQRKPFIYRSTKTLKKKAKKKKVERFASTITKK
jgi:predicted transcriptional regulator